MREREKERKERLPHTALHHPLRPSGPPFRTASHLLPCARRPLLHQRLDHLHPSPKPGHFPPHNGARVWPGFTYKEAILAPHSTNPRPTPRSNPRPPVSDLAFPLYPPRFLLNPSLKGRCFRCFEKGHRAAGCRELRRCLLCMRIGHSASSCRSPRSTMHRSLDSGPFFNRPNTIASFLPPRPTPPGQPYLLGLIASVETRG